MNRLAAFIMGAFLRWFPHRAPTGLRAVGTPDENSPVLVTGNYSLTLARLLRAIEGLDVWLLVANSRGINVWCAACGGIFTDHEVISSVKTSLLTEKVGHRTLTLPPLSAPAMDRNRIERETGFCVRFGPVRAEDVVEYVASGAKTEGMKRATFGLRHRLDMLVSMNFIIWAPVALVFALVRPGQLVHLSALFWGIVVFLYVFFPWVPGRNGWLKAVVAASLLVVGYLAAGYLGADGLLAYWPWMLGGTALAIAVGFDLAGIAGPIPSDAEALVQMLGFKRIGSVFNEKPLGTLVYDREGCTGCLICHELCPVGVFDPDTDRGKTSLARPEACFSCGACVKQCPEGVLSLTTSR